MRLGTLCFLEKCLLSTQKNSSNLLYVRLDGRRKITSWRSVFRVFCFVCLFGDLSHLRIFQSFRDVTITGESLQSLIYHLHSSPMSNKGSFMCHTYCYTANPLKLISPKIRDTHTCWRAYGSRAVINCFNDSHVGLSRPAIEPRFPACKANGQLLSSRGGESVLNSTGEHGCNI